MHALKLDKRCNLNQLHCISERQFNNHLVNAVTPSYTLSNCLTLHSGGANINQTLLICCLNKEYFQYKCDNSQILSIKNSIPLTLLYPLFVQNDIMEVT